MIGQADKGSEHVIYHTCNACSLYLVGLPSNEGLTLAMSVARSIRVNIRTMALVLPQARSVGVLKILYLERINNILPRG